MDELLTYLFERRSLFLAGKEPMARIDSRYHALYLYRQYPNPESKTINNVKVSSVLTNPAQSLLDNTSQLCLSLGVGIVI